MEKVPVHKKFRPQGESRPKVHRALREKNAKKVTLG